MSDDAWYRNETWDEAIARRFEAKLRRARVHRRAQYLKLQALALTSRHPTVALELIARFFEFPEDVFSADARVIQAQETAGGGGEGIWRSTAGLAGIRRIFSTAYTAASDFPMLVAKQRLRLRYAEAIRVLDGQTGQMPFPLQRFLRHAAQALIRADQGDREGARAHARAALEVASERHSGFRYHPSLGLVTSEHETLVAKMSVLAAAD